MGNQQSLGGGLAGSYRLKEEMLGWKPQPTRE